ncbi:hypothetical protein EYC84_007751 [Monilinia fructicola]|uniref:SAM-dependent MTase RsmB/NOP-type domain-containing protein n=1 Tax=Monilinia fructicola TaxID=38448 RepID=A0A5M9JJ51_MONFR|nr:hypothetical protein EYC84_007751 [Monilinia fructicola]
MVNLAGSNTFTTLHPGYDFLKTDPNSGTYKNVGALLLDPSCSGSGIVGRDDMPELHLPGIKEVIAKPSETKRNLRRHRGGGNKQKTKREDDGETLEVMVDDDGVVTAVDTDAELKSRLAALAEFQLELLLHAFKYPVPER